MDSFRTHQLGNAILKLGIACLLFVWQSAHANNLQITNATFQDTVITFDISWDNSWRMPNGPSNWDAAWIFIKNTDCFAAGVWNQTSIDTDPSNHSATGGLEVDPADDGTGVFIHRSSDGQGSVSSTVTLRVNTPGASTYNYRIYGTEMVYVPQGSFYIGDDANTGGIVKFYLNEDDTKAIQITADDNSYFIGGPAIGAAKKIGCTGSECGLTSNTGTQTTIPTAYPLGYDAFYVMKYEISIGEYLGFLNSLSATQQGERYVDNPHNTHGFITGSWPNQTSTTPYIAMTGLSIQDLLSYLEWSGLRPMTETEFEKAARGPSMPVDHEYVWGTGELMPPTSTVTNSGTNSETLGATPTGNQGVANHSAVSGPNRPLRGGFAATASSDRQESGAGYYGVMELSGNAYEQTVALHAPFLFDGSRHGSGTLDADGDSPTWLQGTHFTTICPRGGCYSTGTSATNNDRNHSAARMHTSYRINISAPPAMDNRYTCYGGRGARTP